MSAPQQDVTRLLGNWSKGDREALEQLTPLVYGELRRLASRYLRRERPGHTLQSTALVHEAYLRLVDQRSVQWQNRAHFFGVAAQLIRRIRWTTPAATRPRSAEPMPASFRWMRPSPARETRPEPGSVGRCLGRPCQGVSTRSRPEWWNYGFLGLSIEETAEVIGVPRDVKRDWMTAKAWLYRNLSAK